VDDLTFGRIGGSVPPCELKLVDCPDMGYTHKDSEGPRGEIWIRGPTVALGYYKQEDKTFAIISLKTKIIIDEIFFFDLFLQ